MVRKITMAELARRAGVDVSTVSRALNGSPLVKKPTKKLIMELAKETGYVVNATARDLRKQTNQMLGIVIPLSSESDQSISDPFFLEMVGAVSHAASEQGYDLIISTPKDNNQIAERNLLLTGRAEGLIVIGQAGRTNRLNEAGLADKNIIVWGGETGDHDYTLVGSDNFNGGRLATEHLLSLGRKRILFVGETTLPEVALRFEGFRAAHNDRNCTTDDALILPVNFGGQTAYDSLRKFVASNKEFDAIFAASDVLAIACIQALQSLGKSVPKDISVVGYDNVGLARLTTPALTTVDQNIERGGKIMVDLLIKKIRGDSIQSQVVETSLIVRRSSIPE